MSFPRVRLVEAAGRDCCYRYEAIAKIEIGELVVEADHHSLRSGGLWNVAPQILPGLQMFEAECLEHIERRLHGGVARLHLGFVRFQRERRRGREAIRENAHYRQREREGYALHFTPEFANCSCRNKCIATESGSFIHRSAPPRERPGATVSSR
jgi:hypothetical protein